MGKRNSKEENSNLKLAVVFAILVFTLFAISIFSRGVILLRQSRFDSQNRFTVSFQNESALSIISFNPASRAITILKLDGYTKDFNFYQFLAIPIDGEVIVDFLDLKKERDPESIMAKVLQNSSHVKTNLTIIDLARLFLFSKSLPKNATDVNHVSASLTLAEIDKISKKLFKDEAIDRSGERIEIINATDVPGLGARVARLVANMGGDVIFISTADSQKNNSSITYVGKKTYTVEKLSKILGFRTISGEGRTIADITIVVGKDMAKASIF